MGFPALNMRSFPVELEVMAKHERISGLVFSCDFGGKRFVGKGWICLLLTLKPMANAATMSRFPVTKPELCAFTNYDIDELSISL